MPHIIAKEADDDEKTYYGKIGENTGGNSLKEGESIIYEAIPGDQ